MTRHFCIVWGRFKLENWRLYRLSPHRSRGPKKQVSGTDKSLTGSQFGRWLQWDRILILSLLLLSSCAIPGQKQDYKAPAPKDWETNNIPPYYEPYGQSPFQNAQ